MNDIGYMNTINYSVLLSHQKVFLKEHRDRPMRPYFYRDFSSFKGAAGRYAEVVHNVYLNVKAQSQQLLTEEVPEHLRGSRVLLEAFYNGIFDLLSFIAKVRNMPYKVRDPVNRRNGRKFSRKLKSLLSKI